MLNLKFKVIFVLLTLTPLLLKAQLFGERNTIDQVFGGGRVVKTADFDNDGDQDVVVGGGQIVSWYENLDGLGNFGAANVLEQQFWQTFNLDVADIELDGDIDLIVSYFGIDEVHLYLNEGGGSFAPSTILYSGLNNVQGLLLEKIDTDSKPDLVLGVSNGSGLYWAENLKDGTFGPLNNLNPILTGARTQRVADIDGDGDNDIVSNGIAPYLSWYRNTNAIGAFSTAIVIDPTGLYNNSFDLGAIDGNNSIDILTAKNNEIIWYQNNGSGEFGSPIFINDQIFNPGSLNLADIDNDNDLDIIGSGNDNIVFYIINSNGQGSFSKPILIDNNLQTPRSVYLSDIDNDGDLDVLATALETATGGDVSLVWYENRTILNTPYFAANTITLSPNPVTKNLTIYSKEPIQKVTFYQVLGQPLKVFTAGFEQLDVSFLASGMYFVRMETATGSVVKKVVKQ